MGLRAKLRILIDFLEDQYSLLDDAATEFLSACRSFQKDVPSLVKEIEYREPLNSTLTCMPKHFTMESQFLWAIRHGIENSLPPIAKLPPEILSTIFEMACASRNFRTMRQTIMSTSARWRYVATEHPPIWETFIFSNATKLSDEITQYWDLQASRAGGRSLSIELYFNNENISPEHHPAIQWFSRHSQRCKRLVYGVQIPNGVSTLFPTTNHFRLLQALQLEVILKKNPNLNEYIDEWFYPLIDLSTAGILTCLVVSLRRIAVSHSAASSLDISLPPITKLTILHLGRTTGESFVRLAQAICTTLEELVWEADDDSFDFASLRAPIHFPNLKRLQVRGTAAQHCCGSLHAPILDTLSLSPYVRTVPTWTTGVHYTFKNLRVLRYDRLATIPSTISILAMCPNVETLYVNILGSRVTEIYDDNGKHNGGGDGGRTEREQLEQAIGSLNEDDRRLFYCLSGSPLATYPLSNLRQLFIQSTHPTYIDLLLRATKIQNAQSFEVHVQVDEEQHFHQLRSKSPDSFFIRNKNDNLGLWETLGNSDWARIWMEN